MLIQISHQVASRVPPRRTLHKNSFQSLQCYGYSLAWTFELDLDSIPGVGDPACCFALGSWKPQATSSEVRNPRGAG